jgi:hypothetical protein
MNAGAIAVIIAALLYLCFWPGPQGLPLIRIGIPQRTMVLETSVSGINNADIEATIRPGETLKVSIDNGMEPSRPSPILDLKCGLGQICSSNLRAKATRPKTDCF